MSKHVTMEMWTNNFQDVAEVGDSVDESIVDEFANCVPPAWYSSGLVQCGEPYSHEKDEKSGNFRPTYVTFLKEDGKWIYKGHCFRGMK